MSATHNQKTTARPPLGDYPALREAYATALEERDHYREALVRAEQRLHAWHGTVQRVATALDLLGVALAEHHHHWTTEERTAFDEAMRRLARGQLRDD